MTVYGRGVFPVRKMPGGNPMATMNGSYLPAPGLLENNYQMIS